MERTDWIPKPWMLPLLVLAIAVPIIAGFALGGAPVGFLVGGLVLFAVVLTAARSRHTEPIAPGRPGAGAPTLVVVVEPVTQPRLARRIGELGEKAARGEETRILVLAPLDPTATERWLSLRGTTREDAQNKLDRTISTLAEAGYEASGEIVDEDPAQAVSDQAAVHGAAAVVFVVPEGECGEEIADVRSRTGRRVEAIEVAGIE